MKMQEREYGTGKWAWHAAQKWEAEAEQKRYYHNLRAAADEEISSAAKALISVADVPLPCKKFHSIPLLSWMEKSFALTIVITLWEICTTDNQFPKTRQKNWSQMVVVVRIHHCFMMRRWMDLIQESGIFYSKRVWCTNGSAATRCQWAWSIEICGVNI